MKCLLDLDGVLVDFNRGMAEAHGRELPYDNDGRLRWNYFTDWCMTEEDFWKPANTADFWASLPWHDDGPEILSYVEAAFGVDNVCLLSSPSASPWSLAGKVAWIQREIPQYARQYLLGPDKRFMAHSGTVLIDDRDDNVERFRADGGRALLVPRPWNKHAARAYTGDTAWYLKNRLDLLGKVAADYGR